MEKATLEGVALVEDPLGWALIHSPGGRRRSTGQPRGEAARSQTCQVSPAALSAPRVAPRRAVSARSRRNPHPPRSAGSAGARAGAGRG